jgi:hypothetical protein
VHYLEALDQYKPRRQPNAMGLWLQCPSNPNRKARACRLPFETIMSIRP